jgi:hypothetical protein
MPELVPRKLVEICRGPSNFSHQIGVVNRCSEPIREIT